PARPAFTSLSSAGHISAHGSSLSRGVHAALLARAGRPAQALEAMRLAPPPQPACTSPPWAAFGTRS
ncbi:MAG TPA: hypothetical protein VFM47_03665, partial [Gaiellales bacterium]|nr:hypothetical protein [Gaiellales bacterium]